VTETTALGAAYAAGLAVAVDGSRRGPAALGRGQALVPSYRRRRAGSSGESLGRGGGTFPRLGLTAWNQEAIRPVDQAHAASSTRFRAPSFAWMWAMWVFTVAREI